MRRGIIALIAVTCLVGALLVRADVDVLALVGETSITATAFRQEMIRRGGSLPGQYATVEQRRALLDEMILFKAQVERARAEGYDQDPVVVALQEKAMVRRFQEDQLETSLKTLEISESELKAFYDAHAADYARPERRQAAIIYMATGPDATEDELRALEARAEAVKAEAAQLDPGVRHFGALSVRHSDDRVSRYRGGVIGWLATDSRQTYKWEPEVVAAIMALEEPGELGPVLRTASGIYLVRLVNRENARIRPYEDLKDGFRVQLLREKRDALQNAFLNDVLEGVPVVVDDAKLAAIQPVGPPAESEQSPPPLPGR
jgi:parvulin-like peptidyl-prolyl isomerase